MKYQLLNTKHTLEIVKTIIVKDFIFQVQIQHGPIKLAIPYVLVYARFPQLTMLLLRYEISTTLPYAYTLGNFVTEIFIRLVPITFFFFKGVNVLHQEKDLGGYFERSQFQIYLYFSIHNIVQLSFCHEHTLNKFINTLRKYYQLSNIKCNIMYLRVSHYDLMTLKLFVITSTVSFLTLCSPPLSADLYIKDSLHMRFSLHSTQNSTY